MSPVVRIVVTVLLFLVPAAGLGADERFRLRVEADEAGRDLLSALGMDIAGHDLPADRVEVIATRDDLRTLRDAGFSFELLEYREGPRPLGRDGADVPLPDTAYTDPAEMELFLQGVAADHPAITRLVDLGTTTQGRTIWGMLISDNAAVDEDELSILFNAAHHAREVMTPEIIRDMIDWLTDSYGSDPDITAKVNAYQIWTVPIVNPDGVARVHEVDDFWRKNARDNDGSGTITSQDGVDLNRNYEWGWGYQCQGSSGTWSSQTYRGPWEGSEPEADAMLRLGRKYRPVFDVEYHSYGEDVFYAMSCDPQFNPKLSTVSGPDQDISRVIAEAFAAQIVQADGGIGYGAAPYGSRVDGTGRDHQYHENGSIAFVTEVNTSTEGGFHPDYATWRQPTVEGQRPGWLYLIDRIAGPAVGGRVTDAVTGAPLEADVALDELTLPDGKRLTSRPDTGRYHLIVVDGNYTLRVTAPGYEDAAVPVTVSGAWAVTDVALTPRGDGLVAREDFEDPARVADWTAGVPGDTATGGAWEAASPHGTHSGAVQSTLVFGAPRLDRSPGEGTVAFVTGHSLNSTPTDADVDGGDTTLVSPPFDLSGWYGVTLAYHRWFRNDPADPGDTFTAEVSSDGGASWVELELLDAPTSSAAATPAWVQASFGLDALVPLTSDVRFRFRVVDQSTENTVEAALDDLEVRGYAIAGPGRITGVQVNDPDRTVLQWNPVPGAPAAVYDVVRGDLANLAGSVNLGPLVCIENDSADTATSGGDSDNQTPASGEAFFYLVRFQSGATTGDLGAGSDGGARTGSGGCS